MSRLGLSGGGGSYVRFSPSINAWTFGKEELALGQFVVDFASVKTGWGRLSEGTAPEWQWDAVIGKGGRIPDESKDAEGRPMWKRGFSVMIFIKDKGAAEWASTGTGPIKGFDALYDLMADDADANKGKVPVVKYTGSSPLKVGKGNTRVPNFEIVKWIPAESVDFSGSGDDAEPPPPKKETKKAADDEF